MKVLTFFVALIVLSGCVSTYKIDGISKNSPWIYAKGELPYGRGLEYGVMTAPCKSDDYARLAHLGILGKEAEFQLLENNTLVIKVTEALHGSSESNIWTSYFEFTPEANVNYNLSYSKSTYRLTEVNTGKTPVSYKRLKVNFCDSE